MSSIMSMTGSHRRVKPRRRLARGWLLLPALTVALGSLAVSSGAAQAALVFDGSPGSGAPPATLGGYTMSASPQDTNADFTEVSDAPATPTSSFGFEDPMQLYTVGDSWSSSDWAGGAYAGRIYYSNGAGTTTFTVPAGSNAVYFYASPDYYGTSNMTATATANDGTTASSGPVAVPNGDTAGQYFGFYGTGGSQITSVTVTIDSNDFAVGDFALSTGPIAVGPASAATSTISASPGSITADGSSTSTVTVQAEDASGNDETSGGDAVTLSSTAGSLTGVTDMGDGTYTATLTSSTTSGTADVSGTIDGNAITSGDAFVTFAPGAASGATSTISASPGSITADGSSTSTITVQAEDTNGNDETSGGDTVLLSSTAGSLTGVTDMGDGTYTATLTSSTTSGTADVSGTIDGNAITSGDAFVTFAPGAASAATSTISASPGSITADGSSTSTITVQAEDANGNDESSGGDTVTLSSTAGALTGVTDMGDGTYTATLTSSTTSGTADVSGTIDGHAIASGDAFVTFAPGAASGATSTISASPVSITADGSSTSTVTVQAEDTNGNDETSGGDTVLLSSTAGSLTGVTDMGDGTYTATLTSSTTSGTADVSGTIDGNPITSGDALVTFAPGAASGATSTISASPGSIAADGSSTSTITVQAEDANGNDETSGGDTVLLSSTAGSLTGVTDVGDGTYTATLTSSTTSGTADVSGTIDGNAITSGDAFVIFKPGTPTIATDASPSVVVGGTVTDTATVSGGRRPTGTITFTLFGPGGSTCSGAPAFTTTKTVAGDGTYTSDPFTTTAAGAYHWIAAYSGDASNMATATNCGDVDASVTIGQASTSTSLVSSANPSTSGAAVTFTAKVSGTSPTGTVTFKDGSSTLGTGTLGSSGAASFTTSSLSVATHSVTAVYGDDANNLPSTSNTVTQVVDQQVVSQPTPGMPSVSITTPASGASYRFGQDVRASYSCSDGANGPGIGSCLGTVAGGSPINSAKAGKHSFVVTATSKDGKTVTDTVSYTVLRPSNRFTVSHLKISAGGTMTFDLKLPGPGTVDVLGTAWNDNLATTASLLQPAAERFTFARHHQMAQRRGTILVTVGANANGLRLIEHYRYRVVIRLAVSYTPSGGTQRNMIKYGLHPAR